MSRADIPSIGILRKLTKYLLVAALLFFAVMVFGLLGANLYLKWAHYPPAQAPLNWTQMGAELIPSIETTDDDGAERLTPLWLVVVDGDGYLRTADSRWYANLQRDPQLTLRIEGSAYAMRAEFVEDPALRLQVQQAFRAKYPNRSALFSLLGRPPERLTNIIRVVANNLNLAR